MATEAAHGKTALEASNYPLAIEHLTRALTTSQSPIWLTQRSLAYHRLQKYELALADAEKAVIIATQRARRELKASAQMRRALALYGLKRYGDARVCLTWVRKLNEKERGLGMWQEKVRLDFERIEKEKGKGWEEMVKVTVRENPEDGRKEEKKTVEEAAKDLSGDLKGNDRVVEIPEVEDVKRKGKAVDVVEEVGRTPTPDQEKMVQITQPVPDPRTQRTPKDKVRHEWYQSQDKVTITIFAKNLRDHGYSVVIRRTNFEVEFDCLDYEKYTFKVPHTFGEIDQLKSEHHATPHKLEITLFKATPGVKWPSLEGESGMEEEPAPGLDPSGSHTEAHSSTSNHLVAGGPQDGELPLPYPFKHKSEVLHEHQIPFTPPQPTETTAPPKPTGPAYPTSSRTGPKNWDAIGKEAEKETEGADNADDFFKMLYKNADDDTRKAMMKSMQESNGTALSTDWKTVSQAPVKTQPPEGVEERRWGK